MGIHFQSKHLTSITMNCFKVLAAIIGVCSAASIGEDRQNQGWGTEKVQCQPPTVQSQAQYINIQPGKMYQLESPNYPEPYPNSQECAFQFVQYESQIAYDASFWCEDFDVQESEDCTKDYIEFWEDSEDAPLRICNSNYDGSFISLPNRRYLGIEFNSNKKRVAKGFSCYVTFWYSGAVDGEGSNPEEPTPNDPRIMESAVSIQEDRQNQGWGTEQVQCQPLTIQSQAQYINIQPGKMYKLESPNYPESYPNSQECAFQFVQYESQIAYDASFWCEDFDVQESEDCTKDYIEFWEDSEDSPLRICNSNYDGSFINLPNRRHLGIEFNSNKKRVAKGFSCYVTFWYSGAVDGEGSNPEEPTPNDPRIMA